MPQPFRQTIRVYSLADNGAFIPHGGIYVSEPIVDPLWPDIRTATRDILHRNRNAEVYQFSNGLLVKRPSTRKPFDFDHYTEITFTEGATS